MWSRSVCSVLGSAGRRPLKVTSYILHLIYTRKIKTSVEEVPSGGVLFALYCFGDSRSQVQDRKTWTARTTYWRQMGHSLILLPHLVQVIM